MLCSYPPEPPPEKETEDQYGQPQMTESAQKDNYNKQYRAFPEQPKAENKFRRAPRHPDAKADDAGQKQNGKDQYTRYQHSFIPHSPAFPQNRLSLILIRRLLILMHGYISSFGDNDRRRQIRHVSSSSFSSIFFSLC